MGGKELYNSLLRKEEKRGKPIPTGQTKKRKGRETLINCVRKRGGGKGEATLNHIIGTS